MPPCTHAGKDLPPVIQRAIARAMDPAVDLRHAERVALAALIARAEARDGAQAFWVRRANFAALFGRVERTISTWLASLEDKGWITKEQGRVRWGDFACLTVHLTEDAARYLGLSRESDLSTTYRKKTSCAIGDQGSKQSFGDIEPGAQLVDRPDPAKDREARSITSFESKVPDDCRLLLQLGIRPAAVFAAMGWATTAGHRLADILAVRHEALTAAKVPLAYLRSLIRSRVDYRAMSLRAKAESLRTEADAAWHIELTSTKRDYADTVVEGKMPDTRLRIWGEEGYVSLLVREGGIWREAGAIVGDALVAFWRRIATERPPTVAIPAWPGRANSRELSGAEG